MNIKEVKCILEAILFAAGYPVSYEKLSEVLELDQAQIRAILEDEAESYDERGIQLIMFDQSCQLCTKEKYESYVKQALGMRSGGGLSNSSLEVLAIVAYNQPVTRAFIEQVRGVDSSYAIGVLCERQMIEAVGKLDVPGRPNLYATTADFLRCFGLRSLDELPQNEILAEAGELDLVNAGEIAEIESDSGDAETPAEETVSDNPEYEGENPSDEESDKYSEVTD